MKKLLLFIALSGISTTSLAQIVPASAFFGGLGVSGVSANFGSINLNTLGISNAYNTGVLVASGSAGGPYQIQTATQNTLAPLAQLGYFQHFKNNNWLWGAKFTYSYLNSSNTLSEFTIPQFGSNTTGETFTGTATVESFQSSIKNQLILTPFIGFSLEHGFFYLGAGPSLSQTSTKINGLTGHADIDGTSVNISGAPTNFSSTNWVYGAAALIGGTYFFNPCLFVDFNYTYDWTANHTNNFYATFTNMQPPYSNSGSLIGSSRNHVLTQAVTLTINQVF
jgi:hypothetical protein